MAAHRGIEIYPLASIQGGMAQFYTPQSSHETMLVQIPPHTIDDLFVHKSQTDQILVVRGRLALVTLENKQYRYTPLSDRLPQVVKIPPGVLHGAINLDSEPCTIVNAVLRHRPTQPRDYIPRPRPFPYNLAIAGAKLAEMEAAIIQQVVVSGRGGFV
ncbi:cupin [Chroococcidiopsis sp.]|uniref:cupin n=1 Tax=Chroococcidiopsis sp. TaxID=3088168 RepID=UPI003F3200B3